ncbi:MAG: hypothetical protein GZ093_06805 [Rhodoferax sp.]|uniref:hypothetical protein n=1 Tax=Rhodoferax sp. TaxID=50421 RepID=UPI001400852E|nr:hypothetical protein [Rhodoferax sp.]NDP38447.1 hypothetical protein [Rhodoferax sp.]
MNPRSTARRLAAVRFPCAIVTSLARGRATAQPIPKERNGAYASRSLDASIGIPLFETHGTNTLERVEDTRINPSNVAFRTMACHCMFQGSTIDSTSGNWYYGQVADKDDDKFMLWGV